MSNVVSLKAIALREPLVIRNAIAVVKLTLLYKAYLSYLSASISQEELITLKFSLLYQLVDPILIDPESYLMLAQG